MKKLSLVNIIIFLIVAVMGSTKSVEADEIYACYGKRSGYLRIVSDLNECLWFENPITLNQNCESQPLPQMWSGSNSEWTNITNELEVTTEPIKVIEILINKNEDSSVLKINFSGGRLSFTVDDNDLNSQAVFSISIDGIVVAESINFDSSPGFRNQYPVIATLIKEITAGEHTISVAVSKTANINPPDGEGKLTYVTNGGNIINTYEANLIVEEWPTMQD